MFLNIKLPKIWVQYAATFSACIGIFSTGIHDAWLPPTLPLLHAENSPVHIQKEDELWIQVTPLLFSIIATVCTIPLIKKIGPKNTILISTPINSLSSIIIAHSANLATLLLGRAIAGIVEGLLFIAIPIYVFDISDYHVKELFMASILIIFVIGKFAVNLIAPFIPITTMCFVSAFLPLIQFCIFIWMPDSPIYLLKKENYEKAKRSLICLKGTKNIDFKFIELKAFAKKHKSMSVKELLSRKETRKGIYASLKYMSAVLLTGSYIFESFTGNIIKKTHDDFPVILISIIYSFTEMFTSILSLMYLNKYNQREVLLLSSLASALLLTVLGICSILELHNKVNWNSMKWSWILVIYASVVSYGLGLGNIPCSIFNDLLNMENNLEVLTILNIYTCVFSSITSILYDVTSTFVSMNVSLILFGMYTSYATIYIYYHLPECKKWNLKDLRIYLSDEKYEQSLRY